MPHLPPPSSFLRLLVALCVAVVLGTSSLASATLAEALTLSDLVERSERIALVRVRASRVDRLADRRIVTHWALEVIDPLRGVQEGDGFELTTLGGTQGGIGMLVVGEPNFEIGERVVLFAREGGGMWRPTGMSQGVMRLTDDDLPRVEPGGSGLSLVGPDGQSARPALVRAEPLPALLRRIRALIDDAR